MTDIIRAPEHRLAGANALLWRRGELVAVACAGVRDLDAGLPVERDTVFRIASMSKPITTVAALMLLEEGRFELDEPINRWAPELGDMRVLRSPDGPLGDTVPAARPITFDDLLTHRSGLTYGAFWPGPLADAYDEALGGDIDSNRTPDAWIEALGTLPLIDQPGATLHYGHSTDLLGFIIARIEGAPLEAVLARRIFAPLGMKDTGFTVAPAASSRRAGDQGFDAAGNLTTLRGGPGGAFLQDRPEDMTFVSGGQGLWSTLDDYLAFARLFVGDGPALLRPETLALMTTNRLTPAQRASAEVGGMPLFTHGHGYGMGVAVVMEPQQALPTICGGPAGTVGWPGGFGGWWQANLHDGTIALFLTHNMLERAQLAQGIGHGVFGAITEVAKLAETL
ncbi:MAG: beta-lactamase family protein [Deltaproteobacteria bacterium]|nr:beta-lactamase family protein [Deltaproteobacteria bacterium]